MPPPEPSLIDQVTAVLEVPVTVAVNWLFRWHSLSLLRLEL